MPDPTAGVPGALEFGTRGTQGVIQGVSALGERPMRRPAVVFAPHRDAAKGGVRNPQEVSHEA
ncbi:MAG: hypothetical protein ACLTEX_00775 [Eggerthella lenta]